MENQYKQDPFMAYKIYISVRSHFKKESYDFFKYLGKTRAKRESFENRRDKILFYRIAMKYTESDLLGFYVSQAIDNSLSVDIMGNGLTKAQKSYGEWKKRISSMEVNYRYDLDTIGMRSGYEWKTVFSCSGGYPLIFRLLCSGEITPETYSLMEKAFGFIDPCTKRVNDVLFTSMNLRYKKYTSFLRPTKQEIFRITPKNLKEIA